jgi:hypothetical protein
MFTIRRFDQKTLKIKYKLDDDIDFKILKFFLSFLNLCKSFEEFKRLERPGFILFFILDWLGLIFKQYYLDDS